MDLITSASSEMYKQAFSPSLRDAVGSMNATDILVLVLIAILVVYLLAKAFQGQCRTVCHKICPVDANAEHMASFGPFAACTSDGVNISYIEEGKTTQDTVRLAALTEGASLDLNKKIKGITNISWGTLLDNGCPALGAIVNVHPNKKIVNDVNNVEVTLPDIVKVNPSKLKELSSTCGALGNSNCTFKVKIIDADLNETEHDINVSALKDDNGLYFVKKIGYQ